MSNMSSPSYPAAAYLVVSPVLEDGKPNGQTLTHVIWNEELARREVETAPPGFERRLVVMPWADLPENARQEWIRANAPTPA